MASRLTYRYGSMESGEADSDFLALLCELESRPENIAPSLPLMSQSAVYLPVLRGRYVLENLETGGERRMDGAPAKKNLKLWRHLAQGNIKKIQRERWLPGYWSWPLSFDRSWP